MYIQQNLINPIQTSMHKTETTGKYTAKIQCRNFLIEVDTVYSLDTSDSAY